MPVTLPSNLDSASTLPSSPSLLPASQFTISNFKCPFRQPTRETVPPPPAPVARVHAAAAILYLQFATTHCHSLKAVQAQSRAAVLVSGFPFHSSYTSNVPGHVPQILVLDFATAASATITLALALAIANAAVDTHISSLRTHAASAFINRHRLA